VAHFTRTRANWNTGDVPTEAEFDDLDAKTAAALNGDGGGVYAPSSPIEIGGQGLLPSAKVQFSGAGRIISSIFTVADADGSIAVGSANMVVNISGLTADRVYTMSAAGATDGDIIQWRVDHAMSSAFKATIRDQASQYLFDIGNNADKHAGAWVDLVYLSGWKILRRPAPRLRTEEFLASGSWECPPGVTRLTVEGWGSGGGGGTGADGLEGDNLSARGGGGGSGATFGMATVPVVPANFYSVQIAPSSGANANGSPSQVVGPGAVILAQLRGGMAGSHGNVAGASIDNKSARGGSHATQGNTSIDMLVVTTGPQEGGSGGRGSSTAPAYSLAGGDSATFAGGQPGVPGTSAAGNYHGGGGGGGGGAGPGWVGAAGGNGGNGSDITGANGLPGGNAPANSGAGGGGGGGGGCGGAGGGIGGAGGSSGSGFVRLSWVR
jgi:hypothetical protein